MSESKKVVLVTGASSGFGKLIVETLSATNDYTVIATARNIESKNAEAAAALGALDNVHVVELDVTSEESVNSAVALGEEKAGGAIDVVVNNAGSSIGGGWSEAVTPEQVNRQFDVNVTGVHRVNRAVLPAMRERGDGLIINISSVVGKKVLPWMAPYIASKFALEAFSEALRIEVAQFGVDVLLVQPGGYGTNFFGNAAWGADEERLATYGDRASEPQNFFGGFSKSLDAEDGPNPQDIADAVLNLITTPKGSRPFRTVSDPSGDTGVVQLNELSEQVTQNTFSAMGLGSFLELKQ